ncbi:MAG TPA: hypothetical protein VK886_19585 [Vicinamibacterales bacterium]|nr:hypothetical protein [Vicinamibacterales bacterium]
MVPGTLLEADLVRASLGPLLLLCLIVILYLGKNRVGRLFMAIGVLHMFGGLVVGREPLVRIHRQPHYFRVCRNATSASTSSFGSFE